MAQSSGYSNNVPPGAGPGNPPVSGYMLNGQPPQWGKPPYSSMKQPRQPSLNQQLSDATSPMSSNGTPTRPNYSNPGSLSSHSSRDPSPSFSDGVSRSRENTANLSSSVLHRHSPQQKLNPAVSIGSSQQVGNEHFPPQGFQFSQPRTNQSAGESASGPPPPLQQLRPASGYDTGPKLPSQGQRLPADQVPSGRTISPSRNSETLDVVRQGQNQIQPSLRDPEPAVNNGESTPVPQRFPFTTSSSGNMPQSNNTCQPSVNGPPGQVSNISDSSVSKSSGMMPPASRPEVQGMSRPLIRPQPQQPAQQPTYQHQQQQPSSQQLQQHQQQQQPSSQQLQQHQQQLQQQQSTQSPAQQQTVLQQHQLPQQQFSQGPFVSRAQNNFHGQGPNKITSQASMHPSTTSSIPSSQFSRNSVANSTGNFTVPSQSGTPLSSAPSQVPSGAYPPVSYGTHLVPSSQPQFSGAPLINKSSAPVSSTSYYPSHPAGQYPGMTPPMQTQAPMGVPGQPPRSQPMTGPGIPPVTVPPSSAPSPYSNISPSQALRYPPPPSSSAISGPIVAPVSQGTQYQQVSSQNPPPGALNSGYTQPAMPPLPNQYMSGPVQHDGSQLPKRYPQQPAYPPNQPVDGLTSQMSKLSVAQQGFDKLWGHEFYDLLQTRNILPPEKVEAPKIKLHQEFLDNVNCSPEIFRCTLTKVPESNSLLQKSRLPLGILIHPFKDLNHLPVIQCSTIVRCRICRTYIHPFVYFVDHKHWKCNLCFRVNELPEEFQYDPVSKSYGDPTRRPEVKSSTIEFIAPSEYMLRPPQPAVYLFVLDVSQLAVECGYLQLFCDILLDELDKLPGDGRTQIGFITFDSTVHFYNLAEGLSQPQQMIVLDTDDIFLPCPDNLLVNLAESRELVRDLLQQLPQRFQASYDNRSALGPALQAAHKLMAPTGGRVTVFQSCLPNTGPGALTPREDPSQRSGKDAPHLNPATDFYKLLALDCSGQQVAVDLFLINSQYCDLATISGVSRFSGGCIHHFPLFKASNVLQAEKFERLLKRYFSRKIGFEAVMRIRCSRGLAIHTFHGNFFVRSTDLLSLPNVNPDAGFGMQVSIEESLSEVQNVCFQAALLYTTSKGERRIRVHTLCLPVATTLPDILQAADQQCIVGLLAKMAVDRSHQSSLSDARDAFINVAIDVLSAYRVVQPSAPSGALLAPHNIRLLPLYILALLKYVAFRTGQSTRLDDRLFAMCQMKTLPLGNLIQAIYADLYPVHGLEDQLVPLEDGMRVPQPPRLHLSAEKLEQRGAFLLDTGDHFMIYVGHNVSPEFCSDVLGVPAFNHIPQEMYELPVLETAKSENMRNFLNRLQSERPYSATLEIIRDDSPHRMKFIERLIEDRTESALSYYEFLQHLKANVK